MASAATTQLSRFRRIAAELSPLVSRGVLQHFFVGPGLPYQPLNGVRIGEAWAKLAATIRAGVAPELVSLYLHIPFCTQRCSYCVYHSLGDAQARDVDSYVERLISELGYYAERLSGVRLAAEYVGGGTPTVLSEGQLERLLEARDRALDFLPGGERSFECNPLTATEAKARLFEAHGFNRVSFGMQTSDPQVLRRVNRGYQTDDRIEETIRTMRACRFCINVDLIHGLPGDSVETLERAVERLLALEVTTIKIYLLSPYTPRGVAAADAKLLAPSELAERMAPAVEAAGGSLHFSGTSVSICAPQAVEQDNRLAEAHRAAGVENRYDDTTVRPFSLLGIGPTARSYVYGQLRYTCERYAVSEPFDPQVVLATGRAIGAQEEQRRYVVYHLDRPEGLVEESYRALFAEGLADTFAEEIAALTSLDLLQQSEGRWSLIPVDEQERFAANLFFVADDMLAHAEREGAGASTPNESAAAPGRPLLVSSRKVAVHIMLVERQTGQRYLRAEGRYACYVPAGDAPGKCNHSALEQTLISTFASLFQRVVRAELPETLDALERAILARGRLHLTGELAGRKVRIAIEITAAD